VNQMFGDIVKVTPSSKVVGDMALMMVSQDLTRADVENPARDVAFPESVVDMLKGDLGQPPGGWPEALQKKVLKGEKRLTVRPGSLLKARRSRGDAARRPRRRSGARSPIDLASYLMYPKVFTDFAKAQDTYGPVSVLPTPTYFYGMKPARRSSSTSRRARRWSCACSGHWRDRREGHGQGVLRTQRPAAPIKVPDRPHGAATGPSPAARPSSATRPCRRADAGRGLTVAVAAGPEGQGRRRAAVHRGDEDGNRAPCRARRRVAEVLVKAGDQIDAKDLLVLCGRPVPTPASRAGCARPASQSRRSTCVRTASAARAMSYGWRRRRAVE
jgi:pyruvate carboxylase